MRVVLTLATVMCLAIGCDAPLSNMERCAKTCSPRLVRSFTETPFGSRCECEDTPAPAGDGGAR